MNVENGLRVCLVGLGTAVLVGLVPGCGAKNELPDDFRGTYTMSRLIGTDNATITVSANSLTMADCDVNCPDLVMNFTKIECTTQSGLDTCTVESDDCTGTIEEGIGSPRSLDITLTAKPGLTGEAAEHRQVNCYQHSGNITAS